MSFKMIAIGGPPEYVLITVQKICVSVMQWLKKVDKVVAISLQDLQQVTSLSRDCGRTSFVVLSICFIISFMLFRMNS